MAKKLKGPQLIIANRLDDGRVVFLTETGSWSVEARDAAIAEDPAAVDTLVERARLASDANHVVDPQPVEAAQSGGGTVPAHIKHAMQSRGPSVRPDLGYQVAPDWEG